VEAHFPNPQYDRSELNTLDKLTYVATDPKTDAGLPGKGDAVVVCRPDGSTSFFLLDVDHKTLLRKLQSGADMTAEETGQLKAAERAMTLFFTSRNEKIMAMLIEITGAPDFLGDVELPALN
jgi:hypothetical protein